MQQGTNTITFWQVVLCRGTRDDLAGSLPQGQCHTATHQGWCLFGLYMATIHLEGLCPSPHNLPQALQKATPHKHTFQVQRNVLALPNVHCCPHAEGSEGLTEHMTTHPLCTCQASRLAKGKEPLTPESGKELFCS